MEIPITITTAIEIMKNCFGGTEVKLLRDDLILSNGVYGASISIKMFKEHNVFLPCSLAEDMCFYGSCFANQIIYETCKEDILLIHRKMKLTEISKNND